MSDFQLSDLQKQVRTEEILQQQTRVAVNMGKQKTGYDHEFYSIDKTVSENAFIDQVLQAPETDEFKITDRQKSQLINVRSRNASHILLNMQKFTGDSKKMEKVKDKIGELETLLASNAMKGKDRKKVESAYKDAVEACQKYIDKKHPWFPKGSKRKRQVRERLSSLKEEWNLFRMGNKAVTYGLIESVPATPADLVTYVRENESRISQIMTPVKERFDELLPQGEEVMTDVLQNHYFDNQENQNVEVPQAPVVSNDTKEAIRNGVFNDFATALSYEDGQKNINEEEFHYVDNAKKYAMGNYLLTLEEAYNNMHKDEALYIEHKTLFDKAFEKLQKNTQISDSISFVARGIAAMDKGNLPDQVRGELDELGKYYFDITTQVDVYGTAFNNIIKKMSKNQPISENEAKILGPELAAEVQKYQDKVR